MRFFRIRRMKLGGVDVHVSRTGYTGDLGYEIWASADDALAVWDALVEAGKPFALEPIGLDALDVLRIEAGFVLQGIDYTCAMRCMTEARKSTPDEAGLGWTVELDRAPFVGQAAIRAERARQPTWAFVGVEVDWAELEQLYERYGLPPHLAPVASRAALPLYDARGRHVGQVTSHTWSPVTKRQIGLATVSAEFAEEGTELRIEHTVEYARERVTARVVPRPFYDPERKRTTPGRTPRSTP
jgi:aminomethyltransferase